MRRTLGLVLMLSGSIAGLALAQDPHGHKGSGAAESEFAAQMMQAMERMDAGMMAAKPTGNPDRDFAAMMIPHHQGAIDIRRIFMAMSDKERQAKRRAALKAAGRPAKSRGRLAVLLEDAVTPPAVAPSTVTRLLHPRTPCLGHGQARASLSPVPAY